MSEYAPLNRHEQLRRELWNEVYTLAYMRNPEPEEEADKALAEFDARFQPPKGVKNGYARSY